MANRTLVGPLFWLLVSACGDAGVAPDVAGPTLANQDADESGTLLDAVGETQTSAPFELSRFTGNLVHGPISGAYRYKPDLSYITKGTTESGQDYVFFTFGDTFKISDFSDDFFGNTVGFSTDLDLSDGTLYSNRVNSAGNVMVGMRTMSELNPDPTAPDAQENQIWFGRSFVLGRDIYSYYYSKKLGQKGSFGTGLAVLRGGLTDANLLNGQFAEFERIPKSKFWTNFWFDGDPIVKTESDGKTYLYLFNQFGLQRTLFTQAGVENFSNYQAWNGSSWVPTSSGQAVPMWPGVLGAPGEAALRATAQWNPYLNQWLAIYARYTSSDGKNGQLAYRTADALTGPWSAPRKIFRYGVTASAGSTNGPGDYYNPVHLPIWDKNGGKTVYVIACRDGSHGPMGIFEHNFDYTVSTTRVGPIAEFSPHGLERTVHTTSNGRSLFFFPETGRYDSEGNLRRVYPNALLASDDLEASDGLSFTDGLRYRPLRPARNESAAWLLTATELPGTYSGRHPVGGFFTALDIDGNPLGTSYAYAKGSTRGVSRFKRALGFLPEASLASQVASVVVGSQSRVILNNEADPLGRVYLADANTSTGGDLATVAQNFVTPSKYTFFTATPVSDGIANRAWSTDETDAVALFDNAIKPSIFQNPYTSDWMAIYTVKTSASGTASQVALRTAQTVDGPWSEPVVLFSTQNTADSQGRLFNATYLPGFDQEGGKVIYFYASDFQTGQVELFQVRLAE